MIEALYFGEDVPSPYSRQESLFPLEFNDTAELAFRLNTIQKSDIESFVFARRIGSATDPLTVLYESGIEQWQQDAGRLDDSEMPLFYRAGQLYGSIVCKERYKDFDGDPFVADSPASYSLAIQTLKDSYDGCSYGDDLEDRWHSEHSRELEFMGNRGFEIVDSSFFTQIYTYFEHDRAGTSSGTAARLAVYMGLIDAGIFCNTYARARQGLPPARFAESTDSMRILMPYRDLPLRTIKHVLKHRDYLPLPDTDPVEALLTDEPYDWQVCYDMDHKIYDVLVRRIVEKQGETWAWKHDIKLITPNTNHDERRINKMADLIVARTARLGGFRNSPHVVAGPDVHAEIIRSVLYTHTAGQLISLLQNEAN